MPQLDLSYYISQIFWLIISFGVVFAVFSKILLPSVVKTLSARKDKIDGILSRSHKILEQAKNLSQESTRIVQKAYDDTRIYKTNVMEDLNHIMKSGLLEFERNALTLTQKSNAQLQSMTNDMEKDMTEVIIRYTSSIVHKIAGKEADMSVLTNIYKSIK